MAQQRKYLRQSRDNLFLIEKQDLSKIMTGYIGCFGLLAIFGLIVMLGFWTRGKRKEVGEFYKKHSLFLAKDAPLLVRQAIGAANIFCLKGNITNVSGEVAPFYWWEWSTSSTNYGGAAPVTTLSCFLAISFPPNIVSEKFEEKAAQAIQSNQPFSQKLKDGLVLNTHDPIRTQKLADGSFIIFWQILQRAELMEEKLEWLKNNVFIKKAAVEDELPVKKAAEENIISVAAESVTNEKADVVNIAAAELVANPINMSEPAFYSHDNYAMLKLKFNVVWENLHLEIHHSGHKLWKEGWDEYADDTAFADPGSPNEIFFTLTGETTAKEAINLFVKNYGGEAFILRDGASVEEYETLAYCNNPFRLPINKFTYGEFKRRFTERWSNLSIEIFDTSPRNGGLWRNSKELPDDFDMTRLKNADRAFLHDYVYISTWGDSLKNVQVAGAIKNNRLGTYAEGNLADTKIKDFQAMETT